MIGVLRRTARLAAHRPRMALWTLLALASALFMAGMTATTAITVERWAVAHPGGGGVMVVYLGESVDDARAGVLVDELRVLRGVVRAELVSGAEAAARLNRALGPDPSLLDGVDPASLPASVEITLAPGVRDVVSLSPTIRALRGAPGVDDIVLEPGDEAVDERLAGALATARAVAWTATALFAGLALVIVLAAVRVRLDRSPREAAVLALLGAPPGFTAIPSALAGALQGAVAAVVAALALGLAARELGASLGSIELVLPSVTALACLVAAGTLVGLVGGCLAGVARAP